MKKTVPELMSAISPDDWTRVPKSVLDIIEEMDRFEQEVTALRAENELLKEQIARTSANSSLPPSKNPQGFKPNRKEPTGKKRGGQEGHQGHGRKLYPLEMCTEVISHAPKRCSKCGAEIIVSNGAKPYRHQVVEIPPIQPIVIEHQFYSATCAGCGKENHGPEMTEIIGKGGFCPRVAAYVALFSSQYRQSYRQIKKIMWAVFEIELSVGVINRLRSEVSIAVSGAVTEAINYVQQQPVLGVDETRFKQRNGDGQNTAKTSGWLWVVVVTPLVICFQVILSRSAAAAQTVLGETFSGCITSDRCSVYTWVDVERRQICWAHLKRDFIQISERVGVSTDIGQSLLQQQKYLFNLWYEFKQDQITRPALVKAVEPIQAEVLSILQDTAQLQVGQKEKTLLAKTVRTCCNLLKLQSALWLFIREEGVEPTNNAAERAIRPAVIWRHTSFGSDSAAGSDFVARLLTVVSSLNLQERNVLDFLAQSVSVARSGGMQPSPISRESP